MMVRFALGTVALLLVVGVGTARDPLNFKQVAEVDIRFEPAEAVPGETVKLKITLKPKVGFYTYPLRQVEPLAQSYVNSIRLPKDGPVVFLGTLLDPPGGHEKTVVEKGMSANEPDVRFQERIYTEAVTWEQDAVILPGTPEGPLEIKLLERTTVENKGKSKVIESKTRFQVCDDSGCIPSGTTTFSASLLVKAGAKPIDPKYKAEVEQIVAARTAPPKKETTEPKKESANTTVPVTVPSSSTHMKIAAESDYTADMKAAENAIPKQVTSNTGFIAFVLTAMFWGLVTLLTPCVFPMVPITVSYFLKQGEKKHGSPLLMATVYTLTILLVLGFSARFAVELFRLLSVDPIMNVALGALFVIFALSLFGMYDIVLPSFLVKFTSKREGQGGYLGTIFMALSFSIVSFTCVAPFLGGFSGMASSGNFSELQLYAGAFAFAGSFAGPFFFLALFPSLLKKLPKSGGWMNTIKVVMGFLEMAAALKFFRIAELRWQIPPTIFTYDFVLSCWVVMLFLCGMYLLNLFRLPHDEPQEHIGVTRMMIGGLTISIGLYLLPGIFSSGHQEKQRPAGTLYAWVDAFLLPEPSAAETVGNGELAWSPCLLQSMEDARSKGEYLFLDFTGVTCTNCKLNEKNVFTKPEIKEAMSRFRLVQLYTDVIPPEFYDNPPSLAERNQDASTNLEFQKNVFGTVQLPLYVILKPVPGSKEVKFIAKYDAGLIKDEKSYLQFLQAPFLK